MCYWNIYMLKRLTEPVGLKFEIEVVYSLGLTHFTNDGRLLKPTAQKIYLKMFLPIFLSSLLISANVIANSELNYCDKTDETCKENQTNLFQQKYIFYDVNAPEGFNLRRDVYMRFAIMLAEARKNREHLNWNLVLPPWFNLYHWISRFDKPIPWGDFFDLESLKSFAPVVELYEINKGKQLQIDRLFILQNFPNAFEDGDFTEKFEIYNGNCLYDSFWGYRNINVKETVCVLFQGRASKLWDLITLHENDRFIMFTHGEIALHDYYGSKQFWDCRKSMKFNQKLVVTATEFIKKNLNCSEIKCYSYMSVHWRRGDFARSRSKDVPSIEGTAKQIVKAMKRFKLQDAKIFIATDAWMNEIEKLKKLLKNYKVFFFIPNIEELELYKDGGIAIIEQIIASRAAVFVGTHESTFTFRIQEEREILGFNSDTTFNRLCPDTGHCEKPSRWTIVH